MVLDPFQQRKAVVLAGLQADCGDKSRKGSVDAPVASLVARINACPAVYTTSSCSGRISVFAEPTPQSRAGGKKGGEWVYASHEPADKQAVISSIHSRCVSGDRLVLRFEPFILALEANSASMGQRVLAAARAAGFRESGLTLGSGGRRVMVGVRCSLRLEVPVADGGVVLVPDNYLSYLVDLANDKFQQNLDRIRKFESELFLALGDDAVHPKKDTGTAAAVATSAPAPAAAPARRRRATDANGAGTGTSLEAARLRALKLRQARVLGGITALEARLGLQPTGPPPPGLSGNRSATVAIAAPAAAARGGKSAGQVNGSGSCSSREAAGGPLQTAAEPPVRAAAAVAGAGSGGGDGELLRWRPLVPVSSAQDGADESVPRWGHASAVHGDRIYLIGGYGGGGAHARRGDVLVYDTRSRTWEALVLGGGGGAAAAPPPRMGHSAVVLGDGYVVLVGGRTSPVDALGDVWVLDLEARSWIQVNPVVDTVTVPSGAPCCHAAFPGRYRHTAVAVPPAAAAAATGGGGGGGGGRRLRSLDGWRLVVFGGRNGDAVLGDVWVLSRDDPRVGADASLSSGWRWRQVATPSAGGATGGAPSPRKSHAACWVPPAATAGSAAAAPVASSGRMYVHGGTCGYGLHFHDTHVLDLDAYTWHRAEPHAAAATSGAAAAAAAAPPAPLPPPACFSHSLSRWGGLLLLVGGYPTDHHRQLFVLDTASHTWVALDTAQQAPGRPPTPTQAAAPEAAAAAAPAPPMEFVPIRHCAEVMGDTLYVMGGGAFCFSFGTVFGGCFELPLGGADGDGRGGPLRVALAQVQRQRPAAAPPPPPAVRPSGQPTAANGANGANGVSNGTAVTTDGGDGGSANGSDVAQGDWVVRVPSREAKTVKDAIKAAGWLDGGRRGGVETAQPAAAAMAAVGTAAAADAPAAPRVLLPITAAAAEALGGAGGGGGSPGDVVVSEVVALLGRTGAQLLRTALPPATKTPLCPAQRLRDAVAALLRPLTTSTPSDTTSVTTSSITASLVSELLADLPSRWERLGDLALLPASCMTHPGWVAAMEAAAAATAEKGAEAAQEQQQEVLAPLWAAVAGALGVERLARQAPVANTGTRDSRAVLLLGSHGWVTHREGGVAFSLDVTRCMFSSGNVTERTRMGWGRGLVNAAGTGVNAAASGGGGEGGGEGAGGAERGGGGGGGNAPGWAAGETVVDLYCGIGYYTLPLLVVGGVAKVYACEWNPNALEALRRNLQQPALPQAAAAAAAAATAAAAAAAPALAAAAAAAAPVSSRCEVLAGDCRQTAPRGVADRVLLGLLPSSRGGWETALRALKPDTGGFLHLHHNVTDSLEATWLSDTMQELRRMAAAEGRDWELDLAHVERVKWYAPHIRHIVMDIECRPRGGAPRQGGGADPAAAAAPAATQRAMPPHGAPPPKAAKGPGVAPTAPSPAPASSSSPSVSSSAAGTRAAAAVAQSPPPTGGSGSTSPSAAADNGAAGAGPRWYEQSYDMLPRVRRVRGVDSREVFERDISPGREPVILEGLDLGPAPQRWTPDHLMSLPAAQSLLVSVHVSRAQGGRLDFVHKNFAFKTMTLAELVARIAAGGAAGGGGGGGGAAGGGGSESAAAAAAAAGGGASSSAPAGGASSAAATSWPDMVPAGDEYGVGPEVYYLRSIGENPRREPANLAASFPALAADLHLPPLLPPGDSSSASASSPSSSSDSPTASSSPSLHSSVLRISSPGLVLWTHYDVMDNLLVQVRGTKRVLLWPPSCHDPLHVTGSSSPITHLQQPDLAAYSRFARCPPPLVAELSPGDVLFLPSLWFHNVTATGDQMSISVNVFWRHLPPEFYHKKDLYGNRDLVQAEEADKAAEQALAALAALPPHYRHFYGARLLGRLQRELAL